MLQHKVNDFYVLPYYIVWLQTDILSTPFWRWIKFNHTWIRTAHWLMQSSPIGIVYVLSFLFKYNRMVPKLNMSQISQSLCVCAFVYTCKDLSKMMDFVLCLCVKQNLCVYLCMHTCVWLHVCMHTVCVLPKGGQGCLMSPLCLESQGCYLIPLCYLLSCSSA